MSEVQRKPGGGGEAEEAGAVLAALRPGGSGSGESGKEPGRAPAAIQGSAAAAAPRPGAHRLALVARYRSPWRAEGSRRTVRSQPGPARVLLTSDWQPPGPRAAGQGARRARRRARTPRPNSCSGCGPRSAGGSRRPGRGRWRPASPSPWPNAAQTSCARGHPAAAAALPSPAPGDSRRPAGPDPAVHLPPLAD